MSLAEVENGMAELQDQTEIAVGHLQQESEEKDAEIEAANREIEKLGHQVYILEEENERIKEVSDRLREDEAIERERLEALSAALKDVSFRMYRENDRRSLRGHRPAGEVLILFARPAVAGGDAQLTGSRPAAEQEPDQ